MVKRSFALLALLALSLAGTGLRAGASVDPVDPLGSPAGGGPVVEEEILFGPFDLDPVGTGSWQDAGEGVIPRPPGAYGLKYVLIDVVDDTGAVMAKYDVHLHHFVAASVTDPDPLCNRTALGLDVQPIWGSGGERTPIAFPDPYALKVEDDDLWGATWHVMNLTPEAKTVYVRYRLGVQAGATEENTRFVTPYFLDVTHGPEGPADTRSCGATVYDVPGDGGAASTFERSNAWTIEREGVLVGAGAHLHDGGLVGDLYDAEGDLICESTAKYVDGDAHPPHAHGAGGGESHLGQLDRIEPCLLHSWVPAGERITYEVSYDNSEPFRDVMGMMMLFIWHGRQVAPPTTTTTTVPTTAPSTTTTVPPPAQPIVATPAFTG